jgi:exopolysaccharide biosynthesis polyprenyl glycosylphosphotransferase
MLAPLPMVFNDVLAILVAFAVAFVLRAIFLEKLARFFSVQRGIMLAPVGLPYLAWFILVYVFVARRYGLYGHLISSGSGAHELRMTVQACLNAGMLLCGALYMAHNLSISRALVIMLTLSAAVVLCIRRAVWRLQRYRQYERGLSTRRVAILGKGQLGRDLGNQILNDSRLGYTLCGYIVPLGKAAIDSQEVGTLGGLEDVRRIARKHFIDEIIITERFAVQKVIQLLNEAREVGIDIRAISGYYVDLTTKSTVEYLGMFPLTALHRGAPRTLSLAVKRAVDYVLSLFALIAVSPMMVLIAIAIRLESEGSVFYISERIGRRGQVFPCFKFRTMVRNAELLKQHLHPLNERDGVLFKLSNDPRVTRVGRVLRKYSLDELPQFFNVLRGEMSLVGPRPPTSEEVEKYELEHLRRLEVLPGLTGLWQVEARQDASFEKYIALDTAYVENWSFWLDLKILLRTAEVVVRGTGT